MKLLEEIKDVQAVIALVLLGAIVSSVAFHLLDAKELVVFFGMAMGFYFGKKVVDNGNGNNV